ncbi:MAG: hypothetical protein FJ030_14360 [Chloroflexi bacterium]|nr:hypothetical protein [Chloroflexota bacterium]
MNRRALARWTQGGAFTLLGLFVAFWTFMGVGEMIGGDLSGGAHLVPAAIVVALMLLAWKRPLLGGIFLGIIGLLASIYFLSLRSGLAGVLLISGPVLIAGALIIAVSLMRAKAATP